jgi:hypothetical protein
MLDSLGMRVPRGEDSGPQDGLGPDEPASISLHNAYACGREKAALGNTGSKHRDLPARSCNSEHFAHRPAGNIFGQMME